jgi:PD-(D/E)XK endonuclease
VLTTDQKGVIAEQAIAWEAIQAGLGVCLPLGDERYDLILDLRPTLLRVQCKWAVFTKGVEFGATIRRLRGPIAQLGERLSGTQKVAGSSPAGSTLFSPIQTR